MTRNALNSGPADRQLESLRQAIDNRLITLEDALANPQRGESLEALILELSRLATQEAETVAARACAAAQREADEQIAQARSSANAAIEEQLTINTELRRALEDAEQRIAALESAKHSALSDVERERAAAAELQRTLDTFHERDGAATAELQRNLDALRERESAATAELQQTIDALRERDRSAADAQRALDAVRAELEAERSAANELRETAAHAKEVLSVLERANAEGRQSNEALAAELAHAREVATSLERAMADMRQQLEAERAANAMLREATPASATRPAPVAIRSNVETIADDESDESIENKSTQSSREQARKAAEARLAAVGRRRGPLAAEMEVRRQTVERPTRAANRYAMRPGISVDVNGASCELVDLSSIGCQILSPGALRPNKEVSLAWTFGDTPVACSGRIIWARLEAPAADRPLTYRAGVRFNEGDESVLEAFAKAHQV